MARVNVGRISLYICWIRIMKAEQWIWPSYYSSTVWWYLGKSFETGNPVGYRVIGISWHWKLWVSRGTSIIATKGHAALINVQRICDYVATGLTFDQSIELVRASSLCWSILRFPAGHDYFDEGLFGKYMGGYPAMMGISWDDPDGSWT